jgi:hypothetical protein
VREGITNVQAKASGKALSGTTQGLKPLNFNIDFDVDGRLNAALFYGKAAGQ